MATPKTKRIKSYCKNKLPWIPMQVYRVLLSPEQAVLSCCNNMTRAQTGGIYQCKQAGCGLGYIDHSS